ncbi:glycine betaine ABC transporter substrate-binding protein [Actinosynnema pretiosum subsp. pretiosum]|uniref:Substrate-binding region of ABC-type glycine betaine transport system n=2 Tax=Actinosynnema TaxID=40566 RepID=C6WGS7_ACTMD|nr:glycine betaine ABC transporter substrate-binding protein [Actinosynnema mirum]ACU35995.1 Substrate-binding region of ABC-type glycine betaine transport system [Actinosynnema mirum DSM 43827]AXX29448.1 L-proline glycine betaine binding ABC transporter protein ProX / Osmotic adaptation [Actinosynnema pretiosum subsp. pretiosum]QUF06308.1 glycine betaine ABC transporter substrate-binding protein [Actinosynnema pretiosum subsp. pretiosum]
MSGRSRRGLVAISAALCLAVSGCGLESSFALPFEVAPGSIRPEPALEGVKVSVGSKDFTENIVLGYITEVALAAAGAEVNDMTNIQGSNSSRQALLTGDADLSWDYSGTGWISYLGNTEPIQGEREQYEAVREADLERNGLVWLDYTKVNNTYAFAVTREFAEANNLSTTSQMAELVKNDPGKGVFCLETEFISRNDGFPGVAQTYGFDAGAAQVKTFGSGTIYTATSDGLCNFGEVFTTDGRILALDLVVLEDDKKFFPQYNASLVLREEFHEQHPEIERIMTPVFEKLDNDTIIRLNAEVDVDGRDPAAVARDWMVGEGFVSIPDDTMAAGARR